LTRKQVSSKISWTSEHQHAYDLLKQSLCNATKLHTFEFGLLDDAYNIAVGCCLIQWTECKQEKPIAFASCKLTATQSAMSTFEREPLAVIYVLRKFRNFVFATEVTIFSDHSPLMYLLECAPKSAKLTRWALGLQEFNIIWSYRPASRNQAADCLSRLGRWKGDCQ